MSIRTKRKGILERLAEGPVVGDGSMCFVLEKRGYSKAGQWTPEAVLEYPEAVLEIHREYVRAGADVIQTASFFGSDNCLKFGKDTGETYTCADINKKACDLARTAANENNCLICGCLSPVPSFENGNGNMQTVSAEFEKQVNIYKENKVDLLIAEFFHDVREIEICAIEMKKSNIPVALCMRVGVMGDVNNVSVEECTVRMAKTGADIIGTNCSYDINTSLKVIERVKKALEKNPLRPYLICQPVGFMCPDMENDPNGFLSLPEFPFAREPRSYTRIELHTFARKAWELGVRYIGGCCGFEPHHIRAISQELIEERGKTGPDHDMSRAFGGEYLRMTDNINSHFKCSISEEKCSREYWCNLQPGSGRPYNPALVKTGSNENSNCQQ